ncbi:class IV adenylate cyclase [Saccharopolyspora pogona]|uniref:class IV adenylate cyclase n=1 Tax=Saccharopolyspora pogona TaxID=333966 RepID=UPI0016841A1A|nr:CYTH domain-containing protein [Saccharopolyspora pogona]
MTLIEVERKRELVDGGEAVKARLTELGYREAGAFVEVDTYYSPQHVDYLATVECLRVRRRDGWAEITYKPASDAKTHSATSVISKPETDVVLWDADQAEAANRLMSCIGMVTLARVEKARTQYRHPSRVDVTIAVDVISGLGTFVETEVSADGADGDRVALLEEVERQLGLTACMVVTLPYRDLVRAAAASS